MTRTVSLTVPSSAIRWVAVAIGTGIVGLALISSGGPRSVLAVDPATPEHTIAVTGTGRVLMAPDTADLRLGVVVQRPTATEARTQAAAAMTKVVASIKAAGIADKDIQTAMLSLGPVYDYNTNSNPPKLIGFQVVNTVAVIVRDLTKVGDLIDDAVEAGATSIDGVSFRVENPTAAEAQARRAAVTDARAKADQLAAAAGVSIVGVSVISEQTNSIPYPMPYAGGAAVTRDESTPVQPGQSEISISVSIVYRIG